MDEATKNKVRLLAEAVTTEARELGFGGADTVKSGFHAALRRLWIDPITATSFLRREESYTLIKKGRNYILYAPGESPHDNKAESLLAEVGLE